jgi:hypothetical protein
MYLESATPAVDQPVCEVDKRQVDKVVSVHFTIMTWSTATMLFLLFSFKQQNKALQEKRQLTR